RERARRERGRAAMAYLGDAPLGETTWISPRASVELDTLLDTERLRADRFSASYDGDPRGLLSRAGGLDGVARAYRRSLDSAGARRMKRFSPPAALLCTSGASFFSGTLGCQRRCCRPGGQGTRRRACFMPNRPGSCPPHPVSLTVA